MLAYLFIVIAIAVRVVLRFAPHAFLWSFTPVGAALLYFGARQPLRRMWIPIGLLAGCDVLLSWSYSYPVTADVYVTFAWYAVAMLLGYAMCRRVNVVRLIGASLSASISFFLVSNFATWAVWQMYPKTWHGLVTCYTMAMPFFRNTVVSDLVFTSVFFGAPMLVAVLRRKPATQETLV
jgi:hypothetical protein